MERSGNATFSLTGWSLRPMLYCSAMQFMFFGCCSLHRWFGKLVWAANYGQSKGDTFLLWP